MTLAAAAGLSRLTGQHPRDATWWPNDRTASDLRPRCRRGSNPGRGVKTLGKLFTPACRDAGCLCCWICGVVKPAGRVACVYNILESVDPGAFSRHHALRIVRLGGNRLSNLPTALFAGCRRLQVCAPGLTNILRQSYDKKVAHTRLPSVGFRSCSRFLAVSLQVA